VDQFVELEGKAAGLIGALQLERDQAAAFVQGNRTGDQNVLHNTFAGTDSAAGDLAADVGDPSAMGGAAQTAYAQAKDNLDRLTQIRDQVSGTGVQAPEVISLYTGLINPLTVFEASLDRQLNTPALAGLAASLTALTSAKEQLALQHAVIAVAITRGQMLPVDADTVRATDAVLGTAVGQFRAALDAEQQDRYAGFTNDGANNQRQQLKQAALSRVGAKGQLGISPADWDQAYKSVVAEMRTSEDGLRGDIKNASAAQQDAARNSAGIDSVILLLALLGAATVVYLIGRSMLKPLRVLRSTALDVAERRLPAAVQSMRAGETVNATVEPVPVTSIEEIGQVARAFDEVHGQAIRLAAEQSALQTNVSSMFVNLSRRSQGLVERQLQLIEQLERNEQDSEQLASLFQLDHLATRMRRNSENLLVLAGSDLAKRGSAPVPVGDVLRAAVSEIEQYQRVVVQQPPTAAVLGRAASDMVHLVAELLDNATAFSAPDTQVVVSSSMTAEGNVLVEISDQGVGMPGADLLAANNRLSGPNEVDVSVSRRMGLFVVGRLATRHGVGVRLAGTDQARGTSGGVTASVTLPSELIASDVVADRIGTTNALPTGSTQAVSRAGVSASNGLANGVAVNGTGINGTGGNRAGVNGTGGRVNGTGTGFGGVNVTGANGSPRQGGPDADPAGLPRRSAPSETGGLPRRAVGAALTGATPRQDAVRGQPPAGRADAVQNSAGLAEAGAADEAAATRQSTDTGQDADAPAADRQRDADRPAPGAAPPARPERGDNRRRQDGVEGSRPMVARQDGVEGSRPMVARQDGVEGSRPMPANGQPPMDAQRRMPQRPYLRGAGQGPPPPMRFGQNAGQPGRQTGSASGQFPMAPAGQGPRQAPARHRPQAPAQPDAGEPAQPTAASPLPAPPTESAAATAESRSYPVHASPEAPRGRSDVASSTSRSERLANRAPVADRSDTATAGPEDESSPIFEAMASAWFRENWEVGARKGGGATGLGRDEPPGSDPGAGWSGDESTLQPMPEPVRSEITTAGLPKRQPRSNLIPGGPSEDGGGTPPGVPARSAEQVRGRLASYQQGVRQGRESRHRRSTEVASTGGRQSQENFGEENS
jgi:signal transduction histidine kinase